MTKVGLKRTRNNHSAGVDGEGCPCMTSALTCLDTWMQLRLHSTRPFVRVHVGPDLRIHDGAYAYVHSAAMQHGTIPLLGFQGGHKASDRCEGTIT